MKRVACFLIFFATALCVQSGTHVPSRRETVKGYLVDMVCVKAQSANLKELGPNHTRMCLEMPVCGKSGYAVLLPSNEVLAFDEQGNQLVRKLVSSTHRAQNFLIKVVGERKPDQFKLDHIELQGN